MGRRKTMRKPSPKLNLFRELSRIEKELRSQGYRLKDKLVGDWKISELFIKEEKGFFANLDILLREDAEKRFQVMTNDAYLKIKNAIVKVV